VRSSGMMPRETRSALLRLLALPHLKLPLLAEVTCGDDFSFSAPYVVLMGSGWRLRGGVREMMNTQHLGG
jgi:hypothetical protein